MRMILLEKAACFDLYRRLKPQDHCDLASEYMQFIQAPSRRAGDVIHRSIEFMGFVA